MAGLNKYSDKEKREMRRRNHIARDLRTPKFKPRVIEKRRKENDIEDFET